MEQRLTAQVVLTDSEAVLAFSCALQSRVPGGEMHQTILLRTTDAGMIWEPIPLRRTLMSHIWRWGWPTWPPEAVMELTGGRTGLEMTFRDEWAPYDRGDESLWRAVEQRPGVWKTSRIRFMDYENSDSPISLSAIPLNLPSGMKPPDEHLLSSLA